MTHLEPSLSREKRLLMLLGALSLALVAGALYLQVFKQRDPCPLCIVQRYMYLLMALFAFLGAGQRGWRGIAVFETLISLVALGGIVSAVRHIIVLRQAFSCGYDMLQPIVDSLPPARWLPLLFKVAGLCETPYPPILGLSLPQWALDGYLLPLVLVVRSLWRNRGKRTAPFG